MKRELTLTDIAGYLPYGLKLLNRKRGMTTVWEWQSAACCDWNGEEKVEMISGEKYSEELVMASPILRPMSDLFVRSPSGITTTENRLSRSLSWRI